MAEERVKILESELIELGLENKMLRDMIRQLKLDGEISNQQLMDSLHRRRELALARNRRQYERQNGIIPQVDEGYNSLDNQVRDAEGGDKPLEGCSDRGCSTQKEKNTRPQLARRALFTSGFDDID